MVTRNRRTPSGFGEFGESEGRALSSPEATYTLVDAGEGLKIVAIANNEMPRFGVCYARLAAEGSVAPPA